MDVQACCATNFDQFVNNGLEVSDVAEHEGIDAHAGLCALVSFSPKAHQCHDLTNGFHFVSHNAWKDS